jgi:hypothetical protein
MNACIFMLVTLLAGIPAILFVMGMLFKAMNAIWKD